MSVVPTAFFLVVRANNQVRLIYGTFEIPIKVGDTVKRDPLVSGVVDWTVVKIFDDEEQIKLGALWHLMGSLDKLTSLVDLDL